MGCDIHMAVERRDETGRWVTASKWSTTTEDHETWVDVEDDLYSGRSYTTFAILAGVRNSYDTPPIAPPKGVPEDASPEFRAWAEQWDADGHSHSFLTLRELLDYDWSGPVNVEGWLDLRQWALKIGSGKPTEWSMSVGGGGVVHHGPADFAMVRAELYGTKLPWDIWHGDKDATARFIEKLGDPPGASPYVFEKWITSRKEFCKEFLADVIPALWRIGQGDPDAVRIVFFFDN